MKKTLIAATFVAVFAAPAAHAACTSAELQQKVTTFSQKYQALAQKNPQKLQEFAPKAQAATTKYQQAASSGSANYDEVCKLYDELNAELEKL
ncbi:MAG: hypothetical protein ACREIP_09265 [Alphaproteobacteria bacterium]